MSELKNNDGTRRVLTRRSFFAIGGGAIVAIAAGGAYMAGAEPPKRGQDPAGLQPTANVKQMALAVTDG